MSEDIEHLGLIVSGLEDETKNVDANIVQCRRAVFALLGPAFHSDQNYPLNFKHISGEYTASQY